MHRLERYSRLAMIALGTVALFSALKTVSDIFAPLALALVVGVVLSPVSHFLGRLRLPGSLVALLTLGLAFVMIIALAFLLQPIIAQLIAEAPKVWGDLRDAVQAIHHLLNRYTDAIRQVSTDATQQTPPAPAAAKSEDKPGGAIGLLNPTAALMLAPAIIAQFTVFTGSLFFFLLGRNEIYQWAATHFAQPSEREHYAAKMEAAERRVARYFLTITIINACLGLTTAAALEVVGLPGAFSWGLLMFVLNFMPYLGPGIGMLVMLYSGVAAFNGEMVIVPLAIYASLITIEGQFVTPTLVGRYAAINPLLVFLSLIFGIWLWGPIGGVVAIPMLLWVLMLNDLLPALPGEMRRATAQAHRVSS